MKEAAAGQHSVSPFTGGGEMGDRVRAFDWSKTPLGPASDWPSSLRTTVQMMLKARYQMWMCWGPERTFFCNDAYAPTLGIKKDWAIGTPASTVWAEVWDDITEQLNTVFHGNEATFDEAMLLFLERSGYPEETYHTFSYIPLTDDDGAVAGLMCVVTEVTERVIGERRLEALYALSSRLVSATSEDMFRSACAQGLAMAEADLPLMLVYTFDEAGAAHLQVGEGQGLTAARTFRIDAPDAPWPAEAILEGAGPILIEGLSVLGHLPRGPWDRPPDAALVAPIRPQGQARPLGFVVAGLNPYRKIDSDTREFVQLIASQLGAGLASLESRRHRVEASRRERELSQRYEALVENLPLGVGVIDTSGRFVVKKPADG